jgi:hypothetical protein
LYLAASRQTQQEDKEKMKEERKGKREKRLDKICLIFVGFTFHLALMYCSALSKKSHKLI